MPEARRSHAGEVAALLRQAVHTQHKHWDSAPLPGTGAVHVKTIKRRMLVPVEEIVKVPVVRKEHVKRVEQHTVTGQRVVPIKKYKEVEETVIEVKQEMVNGRMEKRAHPVTRIKRVPYMDYETRAVDVVVDVPIEEVVTRTGYRFDKHVVSKVVEVEEDHHFEMRPHFLKKGETRVKDRGVHHAFKTDHGTPTWDGPIHEGWMGRPETPAFMPDVKRLDRPTTGQSIRSTSSAGTMAMARHRASSETAYGDYRPSSSAGLRSPSYTRPRSANATAGQHRTGMQRSS
mmetsp:Transcript_31929/g.92295  ORF Transcript_31929/g.92295 Transcript_31929/m.92295 type:complete len:287 (+) Transcript_31929:58-918(+)|eukprot:CAMPEP_0177167570 /NCGR_PEP_ID=MMETSP0367-20130122/8616_1 /TAXON_ID=447022 ORGANISM="Scrippsiella hangoei-like, Strain SHHI-4" /NCGR_SAMPLE_ID=MMETSP0367 /ASSEMBLY_ACC=CAM_ASM_000362 /LENGTH=286 /DNA_ID=CAMNT_0018613671 /DNA_START=19 /DNA_END=879 /DNA_ORIENTATION=+